MAALRQRILNKWLPGVTSIGDASAYRIVAGQVLVQQGAATVEGQWEHVLGILSEKIPASAALMADAREDVLKFRSFPAVQWAGSSNPAGGVRAIAFKTQRLRPANIIIG